MNGVGGEEAYLQLYTQGHLTTYREVSDKKGEKDPHSWSNVQILENHLEGPDIALTIGKHLRWSNI